MFKPSLLGRAFFCLLACCACDSGVISDDETFTYLMYARAFAVVNALLSLRSSTRKYRSGAPECRVRRERNPASDGQQAKKTSN